MDTQNEERRELLRQLLLPLGGDRTLGSLMRARQVLPRGEGRIVATALSEVEWEFLQRRSQELNEHAQIVGEGTYSELTPERLLGLLVRYYAEDCGYVEEAHGG